MARNELVNEIGDHCLTAVGHCPRSEALRSLMLSIIFPRQSNVAIPLVTFLSATAEGGVSRLAWGNRPRNLINSITALKARLRSMPFSQLMKRAFRAGGLGLIGAWGAAPGSGWAW